MRSLFRSEPMARCQLFLQSEAAYQCIAELGELGRVQFSDLNGEVSAFQRKFVNDVRRCDEMQRLLTYVEKELLHEDLIKPEPEDVDVEIPLPKDMIDMEAMFQRMEEELRQVNDNVSEMTRNYVQLIELKHVLRSVDEFFETRLGGPDSPKISPRASKDISTMDAGPSQYADTNTLHDAEAGPSSQEEGKPTRAAIKGAQEEEENLNFVAGTIPVSRFQAFERLLWRVGRGIIFCHQVFIDETLTDIDGKPVRKSVFIVFFPGEQLKQRVKKICDAFHANVYPCPPSADERREAAIGVLQRIEDMKHVFNGSRDHRMKVLANAAKNIRAWKVQLCKMKAVFHIMNMLNVDVTQKCLIGECWIPENDMVRVQAALRRGTEAAGSSFPCIINHIETKESPPTFYKTNKFTNGFQQIVNAYGIGTYGELNPAPYAIITFPFLFAVMFGDAGHGVLMTCAALALIYFEKSLSKVREEIVATFFGGRYIVLFMGIFSIYTGLLYNDIFSKSMNVFGTTWTLRWESPTVAPLKNLSITISPDDFQRRPYPFGVDPIWMLTTNKIQFTNSYKMKMAIVLGFLQMCFGTFLSLSNSLHFKDRTNFPPPRTAMERFLRRTLNIWAQFIPEIMFLGSLFGYLVFMIIFKWVLPNGNPDNDSTYCARSLLMLFINLFMPSSDDPDKVMCYIKPLYPGAPVVEKIILIIALLAVPWLLLAKPLYLFYLNKVHSQPLPPDFVPIVAEEEVHETTDDNASSSSTSSRRKKSTVSMHTLKANNGLHTVDLDEPNVHETIVEEGAEEVEPFELGEVVIHQIIHTIEYCLGAVSNTASYLRLWALSLAHAQLSEVLWSMLFGRTLFKDSGDNVFASVVSSLQIFGYWLPWAFLTIAILLVMEGLSAFLHALRLHWVEFMNKFFAGEGYLFTPFDFKEVIFTMDE